jgi:hypothetical protein
MPILVLKRKAWSKIHKAAVSANSDCTIKFLVLKNLCKTYQISISSLHYTIATSDKEDPPQLDAPAVPPLSEATVAATVSVAVTTALSSAVTTSVA